MLYVTIKCKNTFLSPGEQGQQDLLYRNIGFTPLKGDKCVQGMCVAIDVNN